MKAKFLYLNQLFYQYGFDALDFFREVDEWEEDPDPTAKPVQFDADMVLAETLREKINNVGSSNPNREELFYDANSGYALDTTDIVRDAQDQTKWYLSRTDTPEDVANTKLEYYLGRLEAEREILARYISEGLEGNPIYVFYEDEIYYCGREFGFGEVLVDLGITVQNQIQEVPHDNDPRLDPDNDPYIYLVSPHENLPKLLEDYGSRRGILDYDTNWVCDEETGRGYETHRYTGRERSYWETPDGRIIGKEFLDPTSDEFDPDLFHEYVAHYSQATRFALGKLDYEAAGFQADSYFRLPINETIENTLRHYRNSHPNHDVILVTRKGRETLLLRRKDWDAPFCDNI